MGDEMVDDMNGSRGESSAMNPEETVILQRVHELTWDLLDEQITADEFIFLENLLLSDDRARESYLGCTQLHADLISYFATPAGAPGSKGDGKSPVLGFLNTDSALTLQSPSGEEAAS